MLALIDQFSAMRPNLCFLALLVLPIGACNAVADAPIGSRPLTLSPAAVEKAGDRFVLPGGAGTKDGSSWANALDAGAGLQAGWDALAPDGTLWIGSGNYNNLSLRISKGGEAGKLKTIAGKDTGGGQPFITSNFDKNNPSKSGGTFISLSDGADFWQVQNLHIRDYRLGIASSAGGHEGAVIRNFDVTGSREGITLTGGGTVENPELASHDIQIADCDFINFTKRGIRLKQGNYNFQISNCVADAGGKAWATEPFHMGFSVEGDDTARKARQPGVHDHNITYTNCIALNSYNDAGAGYWNADGFCGERGVNSLLFVNCMAFDSTDGGWDFKAENMRLEGCVAVGNKRNFRFWGKSTTLVGCLAASSVWPGGSGGDTGLWTNGVVEARNCTFYNSGLSIDEPGQITLTDSIVARGKDRPSNTPLGERPGLKLVNTILWDEASGQGENPAFIAPNPLWEGTGTAFDNRTFGKSKGFHAAAVNLPAFRRTQPLRLGTKGAQVRNVSESKPAAPAVPKTPEQLAAEAALVPAVANGGFEGGLQSWSKAMAPSYEVKTEGAAEGQNYVTVTAGEKRVEVKNKISGLVPGGTYNLTFRSRGGTSPQARIIIRETPQSKYLGSTAPSDAKDWTAKSVKFAAPSSEVFIEISVRAAGSFDLDDFSVKRVN